MKRNILFLSILLSLTCTMGCKAEGNNFFFNIYGGSTNMWSNVYLQLPATLANSFISAALDEDDAFGGSIRYDLFQVKNGNDKISIDKGSYWGFKSKDMFSNVQYGLKFGWQPGLSPFGIYLSCAYQFNKFRAQFDPNIDQWDKFKMHSIRPGIGIRITPFINLLEDDGWSPILEIGTSYNCYFSCTAPYDSDKSQFNSGMISTFGIGARFKENYSLTGGVELYHYSMFNQGFSPDGGITHPYKDIKSSKLTIFISFSHDF